MSKKRILIVGVGSRGGLYAECLKQYDDKVEIVGVAEPREQWRQRFAQEYNLPKETAVPANPSVQKQEPIDYLKTETAEEFDQRMEWWRQSRFGMFIHWGLYAIPAGLYVFALDSDDGSKLYIDDECVVDNDGLHAPTAKKGSIALKAGVHSIRVEFFQGEGGFQTPPTKIKAVST